MRAIRSLSCAAILACSWSCLVGFVWTVDYGFDATAARRDGGGDWRPLSTSQGGRADLSTADETAAFAVSVRPGGIDLTVRNLSPAPFELEAGKARFVGPDGRQQALYIAGAGNEGRPDTAVAPGSEVTVFLWPREWLRGSAGGRGSTWRSDSPIDGGMIAEETRPEAEALGRRHLGRSFEIHLPVESDGATVRYRFRFTVTEILPQRISWA